MKNSILRATVAAALVMAMGTTSALAADPADVYVSGTATVGDFITMTTSKGALEFAGLPGDRSRDELSTTITTNNQTGYTLTVRTEGNFTSATTTDVIGTTNFAVADVDENAVDPEGPDMVIAEGTGTVIQSTTSKSDASGDNSDWAFYLDIPFVDEGVFEGMFVLTAEANL